MGKIDLEEMATLEKVKTVFCGDEIEDEQIMEEFNSAIDSTNEINSRFNEVRFKTGK